MDYEKCLNLLVLTVTSILFIAQSTLKHLSNESRPKVLQRHAHLHSRSLKKSTF